MSLGNIVRQGYRVYGLAIVVWAVWSSIWWGVGLDVSSSTISYGWFAIAVFGGVLTVLLAGLWLSGEHQLFKTQSNRTRIQRFNSHVLSSRPLHLYMIALLGWSAISIEWWVVNLGIVGQTIVGYGWLLIALYGLALTVGLASKHSDELAEEIEDTTPIDLGLQS